MKAAALPLSILVLSGVALCDTPSTQAVGESQRAAVRAFEELGIKDSPLNKLFVEHYGLYQRTRPEFFAKDDWPYRLAEECALERERQESKIREEGKKILAEFEERRRAFANYAVPEAITIPFDDPTARERYRASYRGGYRSWLVGVAPIMCGVGRDPSREGYTAGVAAARRDYPNGLPAVSSK